MNRQFITLAALLSVSSAMAAPPSLSPVDVNVVNVPLVSVDVTSHPINICAELHVGGGGNQLIYTVPDGKRLLIETSHLRAVSPLDANSLAIANFSTTVDGVEAQFLVGIIKGESNAFDEDQRNMRVYADPNTLVTGGVGGTNFLGNVVACFSGQLSPVN